MMLAITALPATAALAVLVDQSSKALMRQVLHDGRLHVVGWGSGFRLVLNARGSAVALPLRWTVLMWLAALGAAGSVVPSLGVGAAAGLGLALGGATSNLGDRVLRGGVVDFVALRSWPPFNLADAAMLAGWTLLAMSVI